MKVFYYIKSTGFFKEMASFMLDPKTGFEIKKCLPSYLPGVFAKKMISSVRKQFKCDQTKLLRDPYQPNVNKELVQKYDIDRIEEFIKNTPLI